jgi:hypothetical protein
LLSLFASFHPRRDSRNVSHDEGAIKICNPTDTVNLADVRLSENLGFNFQKHFLNVKRKLQRVSVTQPNCQHEWARFRFSVLYTIHKSF